MEFRVQSGRYWNWNGLAARSGQGPAADPALWGDECFGFHKIAGPLDRAGASIGMKNGSEICRAFIKGSDAGFGGFTVFSRIKFIGHRSKP